MFEKQIYDRAEIEFNNEQDNDQELQYSYKELVEIVRQIACNNHQKCKDFEYLEDVFLKGRSYEKVALRMGISKKNAFKRIQTVIKFLKIELEKLIRDKAE